MPTRRTTLKPQLLSNLMTAKGGKNYASKITCPNCNHSYMRYSSIRRTDTQAIRYRYCPNCGHRLRTLQQLDPPTSQEQIVPYVTKDENRYSAKLKPHEVLDIRRMYRNGIYSQADLALQYDVHQATISQACRGKSWQELGLKPT